MDENKWHMDEITWTFEEHKKAIEETYQRGYFDGVHSKGGICKSEVIKWLEAIKAMIDDIENQEDLETYKKDFVCMIDSMIKEIQEAAGHGTNDHI